MLNAIANFGRNNQRVPAKQILENIGFQFEENYKLGNGTFSKVYQGFNTEANRTMAIKIIDLETVTEEFREKFLPRELYCWKRLKHPNHCYLFKEFVKYNYQFALMELADCGDLLRYVQKNGAVPELQARSWMFQLTNGVGYLHANKIAHRDLKMENILLFSDNVVKISDYGFCKQSPDLSETFCGSKSYSAPEILSGTVYDTFKADIWSLGVVAFVMLTNRMPFRENVDHKCMLDAQKHRRYAYPKREPGLSRACRKSIDRMLTFDPKERPTIKECCFLPWFTRPYKPPKSHSQSSKSIKN